MIAAAWISGSAARAKFAKRTYLALHCDRNCPEATRVAARSGLIEVPREFWPDLKPCQRCRLTNPEWRWHQNDIPSSGAYEWWSSL